MRVILYNGKYYASVSFSQGNRWCRGCCLRSSYDCTGIPCAHVYDGSVYTQVAIQKVGDLRRFDYRYLAEKYRRFTGKTFNPCEHCKSAGYCKNDEITPQSRACGGIWCDVEGDSTLSAVLPYCL